MWLALWWVTGDLGLLGTVDEQFCLEAHSTEPTINLITLSVAYQMAVHHLWLPI